MAKKRSWQSNLQLLADEGKPVKRANGYTEVDRISRKALAAHLGVSTSTLRRWLKGEQTPSKANMARINRVGGRRRSDMLKAGYPDIPRIPYGHRRQLKEYQPGKRGIMEWTGNYYESPWINFAVEGWSRVELLALLESLQGFNNYFQVFYRINSGVERGQNAQAATKALPLDDFTADDLEEFIVSVEEHYQEYDDDEPNEILWVGVLSGVRKV